MWQKTTPHAWSRGHRLAGDPILGNMADEEGAKEELERKERKLLDKEDELERRKKKMNWKEGRGS